MLQMLLGSIVPSLFKLGNKLVVDKDKQAEYAFKVQDKTFELMEKMLDTKTVPWVDALIKVSYASNDIIKGLFRPVISAGLFIYGLNHPDLIKHLHDLGGMGDAGIAGIFGSFPSWMYSRHVDKKNQTPKIEDNDW